MLEIFGLPAHILFLHAAVVLAPIAAIVGIVYAVRPVWCRVIEWPAVIVTFIATIATLLTASAGEALEHAMPRNELIREHAEQGDLMKIAALLFAASLYVLIALNGPWFAAKLKFLGKLQEMRWLHVLFQVLTVISGIFVIYQVIATGHTGAAAAWSDWQNS
ncbi:DUF2231 domain-containing protein [Corynebacterium callunae]|uniref:DUF2231 domain-containing protein n=1 Tax=Corynebacterium callunae TaxID=1721 RepID=UPI001FFEDA63|nr:DUF2231 domain-containing protein [Corynebacterium callunae]MCK2200874.1 hypothetical protein [Corynebacterium callunae]